MYTSKAKRTANNRKTKDCQVCIHTLMIIIIIIMIIACSTMYLTLVLLFLQETLMVKRRFMYCTCECVGEYMFGR